MTTTIRTRILQIHRWTGLTLGLLLVFLSLTGLGLVFREQLHPITDPAAARLARCDNPLPIDAQIAGARAAHAGGKYDAVMLPERAGAPTVVRFGDNTQVLVDPCSAAAVLEQPRWGGLMGRIEQLHRFRFLDSTDTANFITGSAGMLLALVLVAGGAYLWWPRNGVALRSAATLRPHLSARAWDLNLHKVIGIWAGIVLLAVGLTSLPLAFKWARSTINFAVGSPEPAGRPKAEPPAPEAKALKMGALWDRARAVLDDPGKAVLTFPRKKGDAVEMYAIERGAPHSEARSYVYLDPFTGDVLRVDRYADSPLGNRIYRTVSAIHMGEFGLLLQVLQFLGTLALPVLAWSGTSSWLRSRRQGRPQGPTLKVRVAAVRREAEGIKSFVLVAADGSPLPPFAAGAHVDVHLPGGLTRSYSLCGDPNDTCWRIAVKRVEGSRGGSLALHEKVHKGDELLVGLPRNHFPLEAKAAHHLLLAAGIGVTPMIAMAHHLRREGRPFSLHYFAHSPEQIAFAGELTGDGLRDRVHLHVGVPRDQLQRRLRTLLAHRDADQHLYICGPQGFMELARTLAAGAWSEDAVHLERFGADAKALAVPQQPFEVQLQRSQRRLLVPAGSSLADVLARNGVAVATSCGEGVCGSCVTRVLGGECDHRDSFLSPRERQAHDRIAVCVSRAHSSELVLDV